MAVEGLFPAEPDETRIEILKATYAALREHGYADLTIERIGEHFPKSTSLVYHHYEGKDELLVDFLGYLLDDARESLGGDPETDAYDRLQAVFDLVFSLSEDPEAVAFHRAMVGLRAQGTTNPEYRRHFSEHDRFFRDRLATIVREGIEEGTFRAVDPEEVAAMVHAMLSGAVTQQATTDLDLAPARAEAEAYVRARLLAEGR